MLHKELFDVQNMILRFVSNVLKKSGSVREPGLQQTAHLQEQRICRIIQCATRKYNKVRRNSKPPTKEKKIDVVKYLKTLLDIRSVVSPAEVKKLSPTLCPHY